MGNYMKGFLEEIHFSPTLKKALAQGASCESAAL